MEGGTFRRKSKYGEIKKTFKQTKKGEEKMQAKIYYRRSSVVARLKKLGIIKKEKEGEKKSDNFYEYGDGYSIEGNAGLCSSVVCLEVDNFVKLVAKDLPLKGLKIIKIVLTDVLLKEENQHIKQGWGQEGETVEWEVSYRDKEYEVPSKNEYASACAYCSIIQIFIKGRDLKEVRDCYDKIRKGELGGEWKGFSGIPSHCQNRI